MIVKIIIMNKFFQNLLEDNQQETKLHSRCKSRLLRDYM